MLQIPSSVFSIFSLSSKVLVGLCSGLFIGSKVAVTQFILSIPKDNFPATRTTKIILLPTNCVLSSPKISFSCIAILAYATFIFASVIWIIRAKGFTRASNASQPPSPPPEPGSSCSADKRRGWVWLLWLIAILLGLVLLGLAGFYMFFGDQKTGASLPAFAAHSIHGLSFIERSFFDGLGAAASFQSTVKLHISMHSWQYSKIILLALASHSACALAAIAMDRWRKFILSLAATYWFPACCVVLLPAVIISSFSSLSWIFWMDYLNLCRAKCLPNVSEITQSLLGFPSHFAFLESYHTFEISMVFGPAIVHAATICAWTVLLALWGVPSPARVLIHDLSYRSVLITFVVASISAVSVLAFFLGLDFSIAEYHRLPPEIQQLVWKSFSCPQSRAEMRIVFWFLVGQYQNWKSTQIEDFGVLVSILRGAFFTGIDMCLERWAILSWGHRLCPPPYSTPTSTSSPLPAKYESGTVTDVVDDLKLLLHLHGSVENRLAARKTATSATPPRGDSRTITTREDSRGRLTS
ncbi:hypothetical protein FB451DRAFT_1358817 [Mycena latifolia]|nr:hypothetical protein FB451DRAFT_1358817 [Mycena latifolia]